jgi:hypothetical protein
MAIAIAMSALFAISYSLALGRLMPRAWSAIRRVARLSSTPSRRRRAAGSICTRYGSTAAAERTLANSGSIRRSYSPGRAASDPEDRVFFYVTIGQLPEDQRPDTRSGDVDRTRDSDIGRVQVVQLPAPVRRGAMAETEVVLM